MFSLVQVSFQGFLQCSILFASGSLLVFFAFKAVAETDFLFWGGVSESKLYTPSFRLVGCELMALNVIFFIVTVSLIIQVAVLSLILYGYLLYRRLKFRQHGVIMATAVFVQLAAVFAIMVPSFVLAVFPFYIVPHTLELVSIVSLFHEVTGGLALALGVWFVSSWRFQKNFERML